MSWEAQADEILAARTHRADEARMLELLREAPDQALDLWLAGADAKRLLKAMDDRVFGPDRQSQLVELLAQRVAVLGHEARLNLIRGAQAGRTDRRDEELITILIEATTGADLVRLKDAIDRGDDHRDLQQLVFHDVDHADLRARILAHIESEATRIGGGRRKVLSDIDDTLLANWKDKRYPKKTVYPGVRRLYRALSSTGQIAFLTARPKDRAGIIEKATHEALRALGLDEVIILSGSFVRIFTNDMIASKKKENFLQYAQLYPECEFVFIGDSGQGDALFALALREEAPERLHCAFIHDVVDTSPEARAEAAKIGVYIVDNYVAAAKIARDLGIIDATVAQEIADTALEELAAIKFDDEEQRAARMREHDAAQKELS